MKKIMFADNNKHFRKERMEFLEREGYQVYPAASLTEARRLLEQGNIDLAILDLRLEDDQDEEDRSGLFLAKNTNTSIPKIILTGFAEHQDMRDALGASLEGLPPAVDFITKQAGAETLLQAVRKALKLRNVWFSTTQAGITSQLDEDYARARKEANIHYWICLGMSLVGAIIITLGAMLVLRRVISTGIVTAVSGLITELVNLLFFTRLDGAYRRVDRYHEELLQSKRLENLLSACGEFAEPKNREETLKQIIQTTAKQWMLPVGNKSRAVKSTSRKRIEPRKGTE